MKTFILIVMLVSGGGKPAATSVEFSSKAACEAARETITQSWGSYQNYSVCVEK